jgi:hypothetical protein
MEQKKKNANTSATARQSDQFGDVPQPEESPTRFPDGWPPTLLRLRRAAVLAARSAASNAPSPAESEHHNDLVIVMRAMADPRKTASVYFAMAAAAGIVRGQPLSEADQREADELCCGFGQSPLTEEEQRAVERIARSLGKGDRVLKSERDALLIEPLSVAREDHQKRSQRGRRTPQSSFQTPTSLCS